MAAITLNGMTINTSGELPKLGTKTPDFILTKTDLSDIELEQLMGKITILNIFPSLDTAVCAASVRRFNAEASKLENVTVLCISKDLPFAHNRFCTTEGLNDVIPASQLRPNSHFSSDYGIEIIDGPMAGLMARAVIILDKEGIVRYTQLVSEIKDDPDFAKAIEAVKAI